MAENESAPPAVEYEDDDIDTPGYKPPAQKTLEEIQNTDADDESLVRYKQSLLGNVGNIDDDGDSRNVVVEKLTLILVGREAIALDLSGDIAKLKETPICMKEGCEYKIEVRFRVKREIVAGLKIHLVMFREGVRVDKSSVLVGSYAPREEPHEYCTITYKAPKGLSNRGTYTMMTKFIDDDQNVHLACQWAFKIKKDWDSTILFVETKGEP